MLGAALDKLKNKGKKVKKKAKCLYDFDAKKPGHLTIREGTTVDIVDDSGPWWRARNPETGAEGLIPSNYVEVIEGAGAGKKRLEEEDWFDPDTDAANAVPPLRPGMRIIQVNGVSTAESPSDVRQQFQLGIDLELRVDMPKDAAKSMIQAPVSSKQQRAIFIAPLDAAAFDKLSVRITSPQEIPPFARGKLLNRYAPPALPPTS